MLTKTQEITTVDSAKSVIRAEAEALMMVADRLDESFKKAVDIILGHKGKIIVSGIGKSGHVGQKIAATLSSTGTPAIFLHPGEAVHGDLGIYQKGDPTILLSKSGSTSELVRLIPTLKKFGSPIIAIVSNLNSPIAQRADVVIDATIKKEADPLGIVPTSSALVSMAIGDAMASSLMLEKKFKKEDFATFHPGGQLGKSLSEIVSDVMHKLQQVAVVAPSASLREVVIELTNAPLGGACVVDERMKLMGVITDGDIRRALVDDQKFATISASEIMTKSPISVEPDTRISDALILMEDRPSQISVLPVVDRVSNELLGLLRIHDIYQPQLA